MENNIVDKGIIISKTAKISPKTTIQINCIEPKLLKARIGDVIPTVYPSRDRC